MSTRNNHLEVVFSSKSYWMIQREVTEDTEYGGLTNHGPSSGWIPERSWTALYYSP